MKMASFYISYLFFISLLHYSQQQIPQGNFLPAPFCFRQREGVVCPPNLSTSGNKSSDPKIYFYLFTRKNPQKPEYIHECGGHLPSNTFFNASYKTVFLVPGYSDGPCRTAHYREMKDQFLCRGDYNIILVDYTRYNFIDYYIAMENVPFVCGEIAQVINNTLEETNGNKDRYHIIGHSLGTHVVGCVGTKVPDMGRITGLDPAGPGYDRRSGRIHINKSQAKCVDIHHTGGKPNHCFPFFSCHDPTGHINIYYNGGTWQHSCHAYGLAAFLKFDIFYALFSLILQGCPHLHVLQYFKNSINPCKCQFIGVKCDSYEEIQSGSCKKTCVNNGNQSSCVIAGLDLDELDCRSSNVSRMYYVETTPKCPYCDVRFSDQFKKMNPNGLEEHCCKKSSDGTGII